MANVKITALTNLASADVDVADVFVIDDVSAVETKKITVANLRAAVDTIATSNINTVSSNVDALETSVNTIIANVNSVADNVALVGANTVGLASNTHSLTATANILPGTNNTFTLGAPDAVFSEVFIGPNSLKLGSLTLSDTGSETLTITGASGEKANLSTAAVSGVSNLTSNVITLETDVTAVETRRSANNTIFSDEDTALQSRLSTNVTAFTNEDTALQARITANNTLITELETRRSANNTIFSDEDTALQARITANNTLLHSNDFITFTRLQANIDLVQDNVASVTVGTAADTETRLDANLDIVQDNVTAVQSRLTTNVTAFTNEDTALQARITANNTLITELETRRAANNTSFSNEDTALQSRLSTNVTAFTNEDTALQARITANNTLLHSNDFITFTRLNANLDVIQDNVTANFNQLDANINVVQDNVAAIIDGTTEFTGDVTMQQDLIVTGDFTVNGAQTVINTTNLDVDDTLIMLANGTTGAPANDIGILFNRGNQGNAAFFYDESAQTFKVSDTLDPKSNTSLSPVTSANLDVGILTAATVKFDGADLTTAISDNVTTLTNEDTALQSRLATNVTAFTNEDTALQSRLTTNVTTFTNEDTALQARITANNTLITELETRRTQNIAGAVSTITTGDLTVSRALVSDGSGKVAVSDITSTELGFLDGLDQNLNANLVALAAGIVGAAEGTFPSGDYGLLDAANAATDAFGVATAGLTLFDMKTDPSGSLDTQDLGALT